jgi:hypothetical protein
LITNDGFNRWSQIVRTPGSVQVQSHCAIEVPPIGGATESDPPRPGVRMFTAPVDGGPALYTIDITSTQAMAMLEGFLGMGVHVGRILSWRSRGFGVQRKDTIRLTSVG